jgi:hypothetical protein
MMSNLGGAVSPVLIGCMLRGTMAVLLWRVLAPVTLLEGQE